MGQPIKHEVRRRDGDSVGIHAPAYTVRAGNVAVLSDLLPTNETVFVDFGETLYHHEIPQEITTPASDSGLWALATAAAVLRGWRSPGLQNDQLDKFRRHLYEKISKFSDSNVV